MRPSTFALCGLLCIVAPGVALAQSAATPHAAPANPTRGALTVAGLRAPDGDNDLASSLSDALRENARERGYEVPANTPALEQEFAMIGCSTTTADCLTPIADDLHAPRFLFGSVNRVGRGRDAQLSVELSLWDDSAHRATPAATVSVTRAQIEGHPEAVRVLARRLLDDVLRETAPSAPDAEAERRRAEEERARQEAAARVMRTPTVNPRSRTRLWIGIGLVGAGVVLGGLAAWQIATTSGLRDDSTNARGDYGLGWATYDTRVNPPVNGVYSLSVDDVCARAATDAASNADAQQANQLCEASSTSKALSWAFGIGGLVLAGAGATLIALDTMGRSSTREATPQNPPRASLQISPVLGSRVNGVNLGLSF